MCASEDPPGCLSIFTRAFFWVVPMGNASSSVGRKIPFRNDFHGNATVPFRPEPYISDTEESNKVKNTSIKPEQS
jgi:hypothetical protein